MGIPGSTKIGNDESFSRDEDSSISLWLYHMDVNSSQRSVKIKFSHKNVSPSFVLVGG